MFVGTVGTFRALVAFLASRTRFRQPVHAGVMSTIQAETLTRSPSGRRLYPCWDVKRWFHRIQ